MPDTIDKPETKQRRGVADTLIGGSPGRVLVRLILLSLLVGFLMSVFGIRPDDILRSVEHFFRDFLDNGFEVFGQMFGYVLTGAVIVVPIWFLMRLSAVGRRR